MNEFSVVNIIKTATSRFTGHATCSDYFFLLRAAFAVKMPKKHKPGEKYFFQKRDLILFRTPL